MDRNVTAELRTACSTARCTGLPSSCRTSIFVSIGEPRCAAVVSIIQFSPALASKRNRSASEAEPKIRPLTAHGISTLLAFGGSSFGSVSTNSVMSLAISLNERRDRKISESTGTSISPVFSGFTFTVCAEGRLKPTSSISVSLPAGALRGKQPVT